MKKNLIKLLKAKKFTEENPGAFWRTINGTSIVVHPEKLNVVVVRSWQHDNVVRDFRKAETLLAFVNATLQEMKRGH